MIWVTFIQIKCFILWTYLVFFLYLDLSKILPNLSLFVKVPSKTYNAIGTNRANLVHARDLNNCFSGAVIQNLGYFGLYIFHDGGSYHTKTSPLIYKANQ